jgi:prepilin-type N-terminal cleavage/methylation domain-containing protein
MNTNTKRQNKGFTLLEILLVITAIGILAAIVLVAINPNRQIEAARSAKRRSDINTITKAIQQYSIDNNGQYPAGIDTGVKPICQTGNTPTGCIDLSTFLVPDYLAAIPEADSNRYYVRKNISGTSIEVTHPRDNIWNIGGVPSLDLNFARNKSLIDNVSGNNLITFTRGSTGTYIGEDGLIKTAAVNEPRFDHNPTTGESLGLLVEESRTNLVLNSESASSWSVQGGSVTNNTDIAPNGAMTADTFTGNSGSFRELQLNFSVTSGVVYSASIFLKGDGIVNWRAEGNFGVGLWSGPFLNLQTGEITGGDGYSNVTATRYQNGWWRLTWTRAAASTGTGGVRLTLYNSTTVQTYKVWGMQFEQGSFPTSYIPTSGSAATRQADNVSITGTNFSSFFVQNTGSLFVNSSLQSPSLAGQAPILSVDNSGLNFRAISRRSNSGASNTSNNDGIDVTSSIWNGDPKKIAITWVPNDSVLVDNSNFVGVDTSTTSPLTTVNQMFIGSVNSGGFMSRMGGRLSRLTYWPSRLPNQTLQTITQ